MVNFKYFEFGKKATTLNKASALRATREQEQLSSQLLSMMMGRSIVKLKKTDSPGNRYRNMSFTTKSNLSCTNFTPKP